MSSPRKKLTALAVVLGALITITACSDNLIGPDNEPEVTNAADNFQWQVTDLKMVSQTLTYGWQNTGAIANVNQSSGLTGGSAELKIRDANGVQVYTRSLSENGTFQTSAGTAGTWTIEVRLSSADGSLNFRVQKP